MYLYETQYTYRSHCAEQLSRSMSKAPPNRKWAIQGCFKKACSGIWYTPLRFSTRSPQNSVNMITRHWGWKIARGFLISRTVCPWRGVEIRAKNEKQEMSNNINIHYLSFIKLHRFVRCMMPITYMWLLGVKVIAPPTGSRKCVIFKMLWIQHLIFTRFASNCIRILTKHGRCKSVEGILISYIVLPWQRVKLEYSSLVLLRLITCLEKQ